MPNRARGEPWKVVVAPTLVASRWHDDIGATVANVVFAAATEKGIL